MMEEEINLDFVALCICLSSVWSYLNILWYRLIKKICKQKLPVMVFFKIV